MILVPELLEDILKIVSKLDGGRPSVTSASVVCREWSDVALRVRWHEADLLSVLSVLAPMKGDGLRMYIPWAFERRPSRKDWTRFDNVSRHVRILNVGYRTRLSEGLLGTLECTRPDPTFRILPHVQELHGSSHFQADQVLFLLPFLPPSLSTFQVSLHFYNLNDVRILEDFFELLPTRFPILRVFDLDWKHSRVIESTSEVSRALGGVVTRLPDLDTILFNDIPWSASLASYLAHVKKLKWLVLQMDEEDISDVSVGQEFSVAWGAVAGAFSQLKRFEAGMDPAEATSFLLSLAEDHSLEYLDLTVRGVTDHKSLTTLAEVVGKHRGLTHLRIAARDGHELRNDALKPLRNCTALETLEIIIEVSSPAIKDADVGKILEKMERLRKLKLDISIDTTLPLTLQSLVFAVQFCPDLEDVTLVVDATDVTSDAAISFPKIHKKLRNLCMADCEFDPQMVSQISRPKLVAAFISQLTECEVTFANLPWDADSIEAVAIQLWDEVAELVPLFQRIRRNMIVGQAQICG